MWGSVEVLGVVVCGISSLIGQTGPGSVPEDVFDPPPSRLSAGVAPGTARLEPDTLQPAAVGSYTLTFTVGEGGIVAGGGIMVDFPKAWFTNPTPLVKPMQQNAPEGFHYIGVTSSRREVQFDVDVDRRNFDGKTERFRHMISAIVSGGDLREGDRIDVLLANTTSPYLSGKDEVHVAVDPDGAREYQLIDRPAAYSVAPGPADTLLLTGPSQAEVYGETAWRLVALDRFGNVATGFRGDVSVAGLDRLDSKLTFNAANQGIHEFTWTATTSGFFFPVVTTGDGALTANGGPVRVSEGAPSTSIFWGDLHSHSRISKDGIGSGDFAYSRDVAGLDFYASTEHDVSDNRQDSITPDEWEFIRDEVRKYHEPGSFVTLLAYEASLGEGHHNVFYRDLLGVPWPGHRLKTVEAVWARVRAGRALTIPHHLGIRWGRSQIPLTGPELQEVHTGTSNYPGGPQLDWTRRHDPVLRPVLEIYSKHGTSEFYDSGDPLAYEQVRYTAAGSADGPHYAQDAWAAGHKLGTIAASDNHMSHPGLPSTGLTAVIAEELTRDAVFDAILQRRTYATTGERIVLEFSVAGVPMGGTARMYGVVDAQVLIVAPSPIRRAEIMMYCPGDSEWEAVGSWDTAERTVDQRVSFDTGRTGAVVYLRVELEETVGGRVSRGWSSPVWIEP